MFEIAKQQVKLVKVSTPMENHGKDYKMAAVLTVEAALTNEHLIHFAPDLRHSLYRKPDAQDGADLVTDPDIPSALRFPKMSPFDWEWTGMGYTATVDYGINEDSNIKLCDAKLDSFTLQPLEGGTVVFKFNIIVHPDELSTGRLCAMQKQNIDLTLTAPEATNVHDLFNEKEAA